MKKKKISFPSALTVLFIVLIFAAILTAVVPAGLYSKLTYNADHDVFEITTPEGEVTEMAPTQESLDELGVTGNLNKFLDGSISKPIAVPGTYEKVDQEPQGVFKILAFFICIVLLLIFALWKINQKNQTSLLRQAHTDALTGLLNKVYAEHTISEWLREKDFEDLQALMMIDMDYFKQINDTYGHATGDQVLKIFAGFLKEQFRATDIIGRVGGDEFMILMKNVRLDYSIHLHLQKLYTNLQNIDIPELNDQKLSCSIGCAVAPTDAESFSQLYRLADHALYTAKHNGRGRFVIYHDIKNQQETVLS